MNRTDHRTEQVKVYLLSFQHLATLFPFTFCWHFSISFAVTVEFRFILFRTRPNYFSIFFSQKRSSRTAKTKQYYSGHEAARNKNLPVDSPPHCERSVTGWELQEPEILAPPPSPSQGDSSLYVLVVRVPSQDGDDEV